MDAEEIAERPSPREIADQIKLVAQQVVGRVGHSWRVGVCAEQGDEITRILSGGVNDENLGISGQDPHLLLFEGRLRLGNRRN